MEDHSEPWYFHIHKMGMLFGEIIYIPIAYSLYLWIIGKCQKSVQLLLTWMLIPILVFSFAETKRITYLMISAPAFFLFTAYYIDNYKNLINKYKPKWVFVLMLVLLVGLPVRYSIERIKPFNRVERHPALVHELKNVNLEPKYTNPVIFNIDNYIDLMFYTSYLSYDKLPEIKEIEKLNDMGYQVIIHEDGNVPGKYREISSVTVINLY